MSDYHDMPEALPIGYDDWGPLPEEYDYDDELDFGPYIPLQSADELPTEVLDALMQEGGVPDGIGFPGVASLRQGGLQGFDADDLSDESWSWHDARLIGVDRGENAGTGRYEVGAIDLDADADTGDLGGSYLPIAAFADQAAANRLFHDLQGQIHAQGLAPYQVPEFAEARVFAMDPEPANWRGAEPAEYAAYAYLRGLETFDFAHADDPPQEALDPFIQMAIGMNDGDAEPPPPPASVIEESAFQALNAIGVQAEGFDPNTDPPPFYDAETGTAYWIGVFQPDSDNHDIWVTSILSLGRNPESGELEAQLAPCVPGDWDKAYSSAEYLIQVVQKGGIEQVFDVAEGMALATDQRALWETERGVALLPEVTRELNEYTREEWEMAL
jgi:hypothetical protein